MLVVVAKKAPTAGTVTATSTYWLAVVDAIQPVNDECTSNWLLAAAMYTVWLSGDHCAAVPTPPYVVVTLPPATSETVLRTESVTTTVLPSGETESTVPVMFWLAELSWLLSALTVIRAEVLPR